MAFLIVQRGYPPKRMDTEVVVPRRTPSDFADIVVYRDDRARDPYLVVETKADGQNAPNRLQAIEQAFGNAHALRAPLALYDEWSTSILFDSSDAYPAMEREENRRGDRERVPNQYSTEAVKYQFIAGKEDSDIAPVAQSKLETKVRRTHSIIWAGGKRDPLTAFDEWSKLLFAKVHDERSTPSGQPRGFQVGSNETSTAVANRVHRLFSEAAGQDPTIFPAGIRIILGDAKVREIVEVLQDVCIVDTDVDTIGTAFERFFGSVFRGELGQYFTMRPIARFTVAAAEIDHADYVVDPTAGSGGFLLEALLQIWREVDRKFAGQSEVERIKTDFALHRVYGIEIHEVLARILKINLLLHHDGHTNIEADRSCLDVDFTLPRLKTWKGSFDRVVGNPPFGDAVKADDVDKLGSNSLSSFEVAKGRSQAASEHVIIERSIDMLADGGRLAMVVPDGLLNNQGEGSNCPRMRRYLAQHGFVEAIVSLPDYAFRRSGAQNKTSILLFRKYQGPERLRWETAYQSAITSGKSEEEALLAGLQSAPYRVFLAEANYIGYTPTGQKSQQNDLYFSNTDGMIDDDQTGTILGELQRFRQSPSTYDGASRPDCMSLDVVDLWSAHRSHRLDPKYYLFKRDEQDTAPEGWIRLPLVGVMKRREEQVRPELTPDEPVAVLTLAQTGEIRDREAGKGKNPPEWRGMYFEDSPTKWFRVRHGDVVFSGIDLWKGCIAIVPPEFDGALVSKEFPVYQVTDARLDAAFLSTLLRSRYYRRAFRAITTGHSNRRRTQVEDFEALEFAFPPDSVVQKQLIREVLASREMLRHGETALKAAMLRFSDVIDHRGEEAILDDMDESEDDEE